MLDECTVLLRPPNFVNVKVLRTESSLISLLLAGSVSDPLTWEWDDNFKFTDTRCEDRPGMLAIRSIRRMTNIDD